MNDKVFIASYGHSSLIAYTPDNQEYAIYSLKLHSKTMKKLIANNTDLYCITSTHTNQISETGQVIKTRKGGHNNWACGDYVIENEKAYYVLNDGLVFSFSLNDMTGTRQLCDLGQRII